MKSRLVYLGFSALVSLLIVSFTTSSKSSKIVSAAKDHNADTKQSKSASFDYTEDGKVKSIQILDNNKTLLKTFSYSKGTVTVQEFANDTLIKKELLTLADGYVVASALTIYGETGNPGTKYEMKYQYNADGKISKIVYGNGAWHAFSYNDKGDLESEKWYSENGDLIVSSKKLYFPALPDEYTFFNKLDRNNAYAAFFPPNADKASLHTRMAVRVKDEFSFDGRSAYVMNKEGYINVK